MFQPTARWMRLSVRCFCLALLLVLGLAVSNLSPRCGFAGENMTDDAKTPTETKAERSPFDLTYLPPNVMGALAIRPNVIFSDPAMKPVADMANVSLAQLRQFFKLSAEPKLSIEDIEEIVAHFTIIPGDKKHSHNHGLVAGLAMVRATHDFDWLKLMRQLDPKTEEVRHEDRVYYRSHFSALFGMCLTGISPNAAFCYYMPDKRTVAFLDEKTLSALVKGQSVKRPHFSWDEDWKRVEYGMLAVAMDNRWANGLSKEQLDDYPVGTWLVENAHTMVAGLELKDGIDFDAFLSGKDPAASTQMLRNIKELITEMRRDLGKPASEDYPVAAIPMVKELWKNTRVCRRESTVCVHSKANVKFADLAQCFFKEATLHSK